MDPETNPVEGTPEMTPETPDMETPAEGGDEAAA